jgi:hypothetical protein
MFLFTKINVYRTSWVIQFFLLSFPSFPTKSGLIVHPWNKRLEAKQEKPFCEQLAWKKSLDKIVGGVNTARREAYRLMLANGYATIVQGVVMQQPDAGYNRADVFLIDDWR